MHAADLASTWGVGELPLGSATPRAVDHFRNELDSGPRVLRISAQHADAGDPPGTWIMRRETAPSVEGPWLASVEQRWLLTPGGDAAIAEEINHDERVEIVYDPPIVMMPALLTPGGEPFEQTLRMRVHPLGDRRVLKASGPARQRMVHTGATMLDAPGGPRAAQLVELTFTASLGPADVTNITRQWFGADGRIIAERREERTRVLGIQTRHNRESWVIDRAAP